MVDLFCESDNDRSEDYSSMFASRCVSPLAHSPQSSQSSISSPVSSISSPLSSTQRSMRSAPSSLRHKSSSYLSPALSLQSSSNLFYQFQSTHSLSPSESFSRGPLKCSTAEPCTIQSQIIPVSEFCINHKLSSSRSSHSPELIQCRTYCPDPSFFCALNSPEEISTLPQFHEENHPTNILLSPELSPPYPEQIFPIKSAHREQRVSILPSHSKLENPVLDQDFQFICSERIQDQPQDIRSDNQEFSATLSPVSRSLSPFLNSLNPLLSLLSPNTPESQKGEYTLFT